MERTNQFDLQNAVNHFIEKINVNELLSAPEVAELKDHFLSQTEELESVGLSTEEAFAVSKMRFGEPEMVKEEYEKSKPFEKWKRYLMVGFLSYLLIGSILSFISMIIIGCVLLFSNNLVLELPFIKLFYIFCYTSGFIIFFRWIFLLVKNGKIWNYKNFIPWIPFCYIIIFSCQYFIYIYSTSILRASHFANLIISLRIGFLIFMIGMIILTCWGIKKQWLYKTVKV